MRNVGSSVSNINYLAEGNNKALMCIPKQSTFRQALIKIVTHKVFETFVLIAILLSTVHLALEHPLNDPDG